MHYPEFVSNKKFYKIDGSKSQEEQLLGLTENIKRMYQLSVQEYKTFDESIATYLHAGIEVFQMQTGIVSHITEDKKYIVKDVVSNLTAINKNDIYELDGTFCREVFETQKTLGFPHIGSMQEMKSHPIYINLKLESYISAPIFVGQTLYGTLNFTSLIARKHGFSEHEHDLISMMAQGIGNFILFKRGEEHLQEVNTRMQVMIGHLAHGLRNSLGAILGFSDMASKYKVGAEKMYDMMESISEESELSLDLVSTILEKSSLASGEEILNKEYFNLYHTVLKACDTFYALIEQRQLKIDYNFDEDFKVYGDKSRILHLYINLLSNAFKYAKQNSTIIISTKDEVDKAYCEISNIKELERTALNSSLYKSVGYGLDIVEDVLNQHESKLFVQEGDAYTVCFTLPLRAE